MLVIGDKEQEDGGATIRMRDGEDKGFFAVKELVAKLTEEAQIPQPAVE